MILFLIFSWWSKVTATSSSLLSNSTKFMEEVKTKNGDYALGRGAQEAERSYIWTADSSWPKGCAIPYGIMLSNMSHGEKGWTGNAQSYWVYLSMCDEALLSRKCLDTCLLMGRGKWIPYFTLLVHAAFSLPFKLSLSKHMNFCSLTPLSILHPTGCEQAWCSVRRSCWLGLNQSRSFWCPTWGLKVSR